ncbi:unnamed protein product [Heligmosomoides polygyrus]|uniref:FERM domain-containing protein 8 n=1 Tax=Heligmosomoides polygyrus TaxID=6339 RepID=A0A183FHM6_HELPZ|nr:unnamed protein product [Heligmosomoides polygyrus]
MVPISLSEDRKEGLKKKAVDGGRIPTVKRYRSVSQSISIDVVDFCSAAVAVYIRTEHDSEVQLKPHHKPYEMRRGWAEVLSKFATSELESAKKDDEPVLYFRRNVQLASEDSFAVQIVTFCSRALEMLLTDARSSLFLNRCPMPPEKAAELAGLGFAMEDGAFDQRIHNVDWLRIHIEDQLPDRMADAIRGPMLLGKALSGFNELENRVIEWWKKATVVLKMYGTDEVRRQYLTKLRESTPCYG